MENETQSQDAESLDTQEAGQADAEGEKDYKAEAAKWKAIAERNKKKLEKVSDSVKDEEVALKKPKWEDLSVDTVLDLQAKGFDAKAIKAIKEEAASLGVPVQKLAENENWVNGFKTKLDAETAKDNVNRATPTSTGKIVVAGGKTFDQVVSDPNASPAEKQAAFDAYRQQKFR